MGVLVGFCTSQAAEIVTELRARGFALSSKCGPDGQDVLEASSERQEFSPNTPNMQPFLCLCVPHADCGRLTVVSVCGMGVVLAVRARTSSNSYILVRGEPNYAYSSSVPYFTFFLRCALRLLAELS